MLLGDAFYTDKFKQITKEFFDEFDNTPDWDTPQRVEGSGVYALYYTGDFHLYDEIAKVNQPKLCYPVYIGKTSPSFHKTHIDYSLSYRIAKHHESVSYVNNLKVSDLKNKFLIVHPSMYQLIPALESYMINKYHPIWNTIMKGFGSTNISEGRKQHKKPVWDIIHPGRPWAVGRPDPKVNRKEVEQKIVQHITRYNKFK